MFMNKIRPLLGLLFIAFSGLCVFQDEGQLIGLIFFCGGILLLHRELRALLPYVRALYPTTHEAHEED